MLAKILVAILVGIMGIIDAFGGVTGADVSGAIDQLNETAYVIEDRIGR